MLLTRSVFLRTGSFGTLSRRLVKVLARRLKGMALAVDAQKQSGHPLARKAAP
jgi:hypothetical protein